MVCTQWNCQIVDAIGEGDSVGSDMPTPPLLFLSLSDIAGQKAGVMPRLHMPQAILTSRLLSADGAVAGQVRRPGGIQHLFKRWSRSLPGISCPCWHLWPAPLQHQTEPFLFSLALAISCVLHSVTSNYRFSFELTNCADDIFFFHFKSSKRRNSLLRCVCVLWFFKQAS